MKDSLIQPRTWTAQIHEMLFHRWGCWTPSTCTELWWGLWFCHLAPLIYRCIGKRHGAKQELGSLME